MEWRVGVRWGGGNDTSPLLKCFDAPSVFGEKPRSQGGGEWAGIKIFLNKERKTGCAVDMGEAQ